jgi:hypothetical protein
MISARHRSGRDRAETTLGDLRPRLNHLSYRPPRGRYHVLVVWGFTSDGADREPVGAFSILDTVTGDEVERANPARLTRAAKVAERMREQAQRMNRADAA